MTPSTSKSHLHERFEIVCDCLRWGWVEANTRQKLVVEYYLLKSLLEANGEKFPFEY